MHASIVPRDNASLVTEAVMNDGRALQYASENLKKDAGHEDSVRNVGGKSILASSHSSLRGSDVVLAVGFALVQL